MALVCSLNVHPISFAPIINPNRTSSPKFSIHHKTPRSPPRFPVRLRSRFRRSSCLQFPIVGELGKESDQSRTQGDNKEDFGVKVALSMLRFYKREISPLMPNSCRYVPTCSEYSMTAYKKYGVIKGSILTTWRLCRCNPLGGSGFDPPRWFDEPTPPEQ
ncbi:UPF0161 protein At3g09310 isoform X2 [Cynara cardunculus var. scolymus]|uniref:Putative membrane protein insertion efficiency factor n=1 Tax=Cynara cardunculus var. scolymus TaxID=59895 RepID=A0A118JW39_CYNCS|nr:UPF0161 protein At3g09310 isoform X2 [Cynara cardunculus var. scolymus]XP_024981367.1 UPF0161 protein At3g09310 isoform X2 [Cynara cardunculus var. scolymus]KVH95049.1 putative membrane protein insertion efficiency factor [Cynara cardunculus var. scolymus]